MPHVEIEGHKVFLAESDPIPEIKAFHGREDELSKCKAAWGIDQKSNLLCNKLFRLHFRLQGAPGIGKNEIVYEIVRHVQKEQEVPFYMIQGHEELTPEDLSLVLVPGKDSQNPESPSLILRASKLATAIYQGGFFFFDEINRVPERTLAPLASVLDNRQYLYSALAGMRIKSKSNKARLSFRFCCALNPEFSESGIGGLPGYIAERTLPVINVKPPKFAELCKIIERNLNLSPDSEFLKEFRRRLNTKDYKETSIRQALSLVMYAMNHAGTNPNVSDAFDTAIESILGKSEAQNKT